MVSAIMIHTAELNTLRDHLAEEEKLTFWGGGNKVIDKESTAFATALQEAMSPRAMELTRRQVRQTHADHT